MGEAGSPARKSQARLVNSRKVLEIVVKEVVDKTCAGELCIRTKFKVVHNKQTSTTTLGFLDGMIRRVATQFLTCSRPSGKLIISGASSVNMSSTAASALGKYKCRRLDGKVAVVTASTLGLSIYKLSAHIARE